MLYPLPIFFIFLPPYLCISFFNCSVSYPPLPQLYTSLLIKIKYSSCLPPFFPPVVTVLPPSVRMCLCCHNSTVFREILLSLQLWNPADEAPDLVKIRQKFWELHMKISVRFRVAGEINLPAKLFVQCNN